MAKQKGVIPISGTIDNLTFLQSPFGDLVRKKSSLTKKKVKTSKAFAGSRQAGKEFGRSGRDGSLLRRGVKGAGILAENMHTHYRLNKMLREVITADSTHGRGERKVMPENLELLYGFDWNEDYPVCRQLIAAFRMDRTVPGEFRVIIDTFRPKADLNWSPGATHAEVFLLQAAVDFDAHHVATTLVSSGLLARTDDAAGALTLVGTVTADMVITGLGVRYYAERYGKQNALVEGRGFVLLG